MILIKKIYLFTAAVFLVFDGASTAYAANINGGEREENIPVAFQGSSPEASFTINYDDLSYIYKISVFKAGPSDRSFAPKNRASLGTRINRSNPNPTRLEGNRVNFDLLATRDNLQLLSKIRRELEAIPDELPMQYWGRNEQLAYWLNLYNVTVLEQIGLEYPIMSLKKIYKKSRSKPALWDRKLLNVSGVSLSLNDIHHEILIPKWGNPLLMYGLFHGFVGSANMRNEAYTGKEVYDQLTENAREFINSNRGVHFRDGTMRISKLYEINKALFPDWAKKLRVHFYSYGDWPLRGKVENTYRIKANVTDWYIADLFNGHPGLATSANTNGAAFLAGLPPQADPFKYVSKMMTGTRYPVHVVEYMHRIKQRNIKSRSGTVSIEPVATEEKKTDKK